MTGPLYRDKTGPLLIAFGVVLIFLLGGVFINFATRDQVTITVTDKQTKLRCDGADHSNCHDEYLIFTSRGVYKNTDNLLFLKFNSSDLYGQLIEGRTYRCEINGLRIPLLSTYKNLIKCKEAGR